MSDQVYLSLAAQEASFGMSKGDGGPFGAVLVYKDMVIASTHNTVLVAKDPTCHAEINAIRWATREMGQLFLDNCTVYSTTEPCPMCFSALHWARVKRVVYSTTIQDVKRLGFNELSVSAAMMKKVGKSKVRLSQFKNEDCENLLRVWKKLSSKKTY